MDLENNQQKLQVTDEKVEEIEIEENNLEVSSDDSENDMNVNIINNKKGVKLHTIKSKIKVIKYAEVHNISEASRHFGIARKTISDWVHNKTNLLNTPKESLNKTTLHKGKRPESYNIENKLISFIEFNRKLLNPISTTSILIKLLEYAPKELIYKSFRCTGIANNLDSSEDNLFTAWSHMKEEKPLIENEIMYDIDEEEVVDSDSD